MTPAILVSTGSLFQWPDTFDAKIHAILDAGADGVELIPDLRTWQPAPETVARLRNRPVTIHGELYPDRGITLAVWAALVARLPFRFLNAVFHPDELAPGDLAALARLPFPASIENMDPRRDDWRTVDEVQRFLMPAPHVGWTLDTAHVEENGLEVESFRPLFAPRETHLSAAHASYYDFNHALVHLRPASEFPYVPSGCPLVTLEGVVPVGGTWLEDEVEYVRGRV